MLRIRNKIKERWWATRIKIYHRKINRQKYYGVKKIIKEYEKEIQAIYEPLFKKIKEIKEANIQEAFKIKNILALIGEVVIPVRSIDKIQQFIKEAYEKGGKRVFTKTAHKIKVAEVKPTPILRSIHVRQIQYLEKLNEDLKEAIENILIDGVAEGKEIYEITKEIEDKVKRKIKTRAETIARSEIIKASAEGTRQIMRQAGVKHYIWLTARDDRVCKTCQALDGKKFRIDDPNAPLPVKDTHPNCRCVLVADI